MTWFLAERGWERFSAAESRRVVDEPVQVVDLFLGQTLDSVPARGHGHAALAQPLTYTDGRLGVLVVASRPWSCCRSWPCCRRHGEAAVGPCPSTKLLASCHRGFPRSARNRAASRALEVVQRATEQVDVARHRLILARTDAEVHAAVEGANRCVLERAHALAAPGMVVNDDEETARRTDAAPYEVLAARRAVHPEVAEERIVAVAPRYASWRRLLVRAKTLPGSGPGTADVR